MSALSSVIARGTRAAQPAASSLPIGSLYYVTDEVKTERNSGSAWESYSATGTSVVVQVVKTETGAVNTGSTVIPLDDTIPQNTEGDEYMTLAITPQSASNRLKIEVCCYLSSLQPNWLIAALFQDSTANALACASAYIAVGTAAAMVTFTHIMTAGTTSATTFKVRGGRDASAGTTVTFNGKSSARLFGGVLASSIVITELTP